MIFDNNTTVLSSNAKVIEGYSDSCACARALVESAQSDFAMFKAMMGVEYQAIKNEQSGYTNESSEMVSLMEASASSIWAKIKELFRKLRDKVKSILAAIRRKFDSLTMEDDKLINKYKKALSQNQAQVNSIEVKYRKKKDTDAGIPDFKAGIKDADALSGKWKPEVADRWKELWNAENASELREKELEDCWADDSAEDYKLSEIGGITKFLDELKGYKARVKKFDAKCSEIIKFCDTQVTKYDKVKNGNSERANDHKDDEKSEERVSTAARTYDMATIYQQGVITILGVAQEVMKADYKQVKAIVAKAVASIGKKAKDEAAYLDALAETVEDAVEDVIDGAIDGVAGDEITAQNIASDAVKDADVSDDPDKLTYDPDGYTQHDPVKDADGTQDIDITGTTTSIAKESAYFGEMLY